MPDVSGEYQGARITKMKLMLCIFFLFLAPAVNAVEIAYSSIHIGIMHPNGVDLVGYSTEKQLNNHWYRFYTFGLPALAATGFSYYDYYQGNGFTHTLGIGIGSVIYGSIAYQHQLNKKQYLKIGVGLTTGIAYSGIYPVFAYENRF